MKNIFIELCIEKNSKLKPNDLLLEFVYFYKGLHKAIRSSTLAVAIHSTVSEAP
jgi:hypothetical protein